MNKVILDGKYIKSKDLLHLYIKYGLETREYIGSNLDALWDVLTTYSQTLSISLYNKDMLIENLGDYGRALIKLFEDAIEENPNIKLEIH